MCISFRSRDSRDDTASFVDTNGLNDTAYYCVVQSANPNATPFHARILLGILCVLASTTVPVAAAEKFTVPASPHADYSFNPGWKFFKGDAAGAEQVAFDDSKWTDVSAPHTFNDVDSFQHFISHSGGDRNAWSGIVWYRKHFNCRPARRMGKCFLSSKG
jgi:hypothetical protein